jgi:hypothetical protein
MSDYLAYTSGVVRLFDTLEAANGWLAEVGGGEVFVAADQLAERTLQHRVQLDNAVNLTARLADAAHKVVSVNQELVEVIVERDKLTSRLAAAQEALAKFKCETCGKLSIALDTELCCCNIATISVATFPVIEDGCFTGDTLTIEVDDVQKNSGCGGEIRGPRSCDNE